MIVRCRNAITVLIDIDMVVIRIVVGSTADKSCETY